MLEALDAIPEGIRACGWVTKMLYLPVLGCYDRWQTPVHVERDQRGMLRWLADGDE